MYLHCVYKMTFYIGLGYILEKPQQYEAKNVILLQHLDNMTLSCVTKHVKLKEENNTLKFYTQRKLSKKEKYLVWEHFYTRLVIGERELLYTPQPP